MSRDVAEEFDPGAWKFTEQVADVFDAHVRASVPHYDLIQDMIGSVCDWAASRGALVADLGAAIGTTAAVIEARHAARELRYVLYDDSAAMLDKARARLAGLDGRARFEQRRLQAGLDHERAAVTCCLFTLQFLPLRDRVPVLREAHETTEPGGVLLLAEKVRPLNSRWFEIGNDLSHDWKAAHGIEAEAIRAKSLALRGVLEPVPLPSLLDMVRAAGWCSPEVLFKWNCWVLLGAIRDLGSD